MAQADTSGAGRIRPRVWTGLVAVLVHVAPAAGRGNILRGAEDTP